MTTDQGNCLINMRLADVLLASYDPNGQPARGPALPPLTLRLQALPLQQELRLVLRLVLQQVQTQELRLVLQQELRLGLLPA